MASQCVDLQGVDQLWKIAPQRGLNGESTAPSQSSCSPSCKQVLNLWLSPSPKRWKNGAFPLCHQSILELFWRLCLCVPVWSGREGELHHAVVFLCVLIWLSGEGGAEGGGSSPASSPFLPCTSKMGAWSYKVNFSTFDCFGIFEPSAQLTGRTAPWWATVASCFLDFAGISLPPEWSNDFLTLLWDTVPSRPWTGDAGKRAYFVGLPPLGWTKHWGMFPWPSLCLLCTAESLPGKRV